MCGHQCGYEVAVLKNDDKHLCTVGATSLVKMTTVFDVELMDNATGCAVQMPGIWRVARWIKKAVHCQYRKDLFQQLCLFATLASFYPVSPVYLLAPKTHARVVSPL
jgi:hypothetical protein